MKRLGKWAATALSGMATWQVRSMIQEPPTFDVGECQEANLMCFWLSFEDVFLVFVLFKVEVVRSAGWFSF